MPSRTGVARVGLEACTLGDGGGMAGLCPVHTVQVNVLGKIINKLIFTTKISSSVPCMNNS